MKQPMGKKQVQAPRMLQSQMGSKGGVHHVAAGASGEPFESGHKQRVLEFEPLIREEFVAQTVNGTSKPWGTGWNRTSPISFDELPPAPTWPGGRSNRTGE